MRECEGKNQKSIDLKFVKAFLSLCRTKRSYDVMYDAGGYGVKSELRA